MRKIVLLIALFGSWQVLAIDAHPGLNGPWHQADRSGQGLVIHVIPDSNQVFLAWFTYQPSGGEQMWLTAHGALGSDTIELTIYQATDGQLNNPDQLPTNNPWGTGQLTFNDCLSADFSYSGPNGLSGTMDLTRVTAPINCSEV
ncbi:hypothetical protein [Marinicella meishanensis]|uniref:hypothetical protein n=1 Tax=Marinicella meishanensis TaxID=2873263 RepID=UPI001CC00A71|nr:hypothetical protein [Marinicella sp. NBU2979]